jgi:hypothetical protein
LNGWRFTASWEIALAGPFSNDLVSRQALAEDNPPRAVPASIASRGTGIRQKDGDKKMWVKGYRQNIYKALTAG